jgi:hypothetical protein
MLKATLSAADHLDIMALEKHVVHGPLLHVDGHDVSEASVQPPLLGSVVLLQLDRRATAHPPGLRTFADAGV